jgi:hypothetical protein
VRRRLVVLAASVLVAATMRADETAGPRIRVEPAGFDFGRVLPRRALRKEFRLRNLGDQVLVIGRVSGSCRCTAAEADAASLEPGASTPLRVELETPEAPGSIEESVVVRSNDPEIPLLEIVLRATVVAEKPQ